MKTRVPDKPDGTTQIHNAKFYTIKPRGIVSMAHNKLLQCLALSREDCTVELWNMQYAPYLERTLITGSLVEGLAWAGKRLFSVSLMGQLVEWNLRTLQPRKEVSPTGNALWCLDINSQETELAVGSEEGHINILSIEQDEINYKTLFQKHRGRVLCCKFDKTGQHLVTGSVGNVSIWNAAKGNILYTMSLSAQDVVVWSLQVLSDFTVIAGDSVGNVTMWNGENGVHIESCKVLDRDVFALAVNEQEDRLICSGMEPPLIRVLAKTQIKREESVFERWIKFLQRDVHKHYVKALAVIDDRIISGGQDGILCITSASKTQATVARYAPYLQNPCVSVVPKSKLILLRYPDSVQLWRLGAAVKSNADAVIKSVTRSEEDAEQLQVEQMPEKLLQLNVGKHVQAAAISPNGAFICYSTSTDVRLSRFQEATESNAASLERLSENLPEEFTPATHIIFTKGSESLLLLDAATKELRCFNLQSDEVHFAYVIELGKQVKSLITHVEVSQSGSYVVIASIDHLIAVWLLNNGKQHKHLLNLPRHKAATTALTLRDDAPVLVVAYADGHMAEYDLNERRFISETNLHSLTNSSSTHTVRSLLLDPQNPNIIIAHNEVFVYVLEKIVKDQEPEPTAKTKRLSTQSPIVTEDKVKSFRLKLQLNREHLVQICRLGPKELVTVGVQTSNLLASLPEPFERKKFGAA